MYVLINALLCAVNVVFYVAVGHHWWSLGAAVFSGLCTLYSIALEVRR